MTDGFEGVPTGIHFETGEARVPDPISQSTSLEEKVGVVPSGAGIKGHGPWTQTDGER